MTRARCTPEIMKDRERERTVGRKEMRERLRERGWGVGIMSRERKKFQFTTEFPNAYCAVLCPYS
jgi:hypothetical protein